MARMIVAATLAVGCGGLPVGEFAPTLAVTACDRIDECVEPLTDPDRAACDDEVEGLITGLMDEVDGWSVYEPVSGQACVEDLETIACDDLVGIEWRCDLSSRGYLSLTFGPTE